MPQTEEDRETTTPTGKAAGDLVINRMLRNFGQRPEEPLSKQKFGEILDKKD